MALGLSTLIAGCGGGGNSVVQQPPTTYVLTVDSATPASGVAIAVSPADNDKAANGTTTFARSYNAGTAITLTAPAKSGANTFVSWAGCTSASTVTCSVTLNGNTTVTANYSAAVASGNTWYVSGTGSDSNNGQTPATAS